MSVEYDHFGDDARAQKRATHADATQALKNATAHKYQETNLAGMKDDDGKLPLYLLPHDALMEVAKVLNHGQVKYTARNWEKGMHWSRPYSAMMRHMWAWWRGEDRDAETGLSHLAHAACCVLFLLSYSIRGAGGDDRPETENPLANSQE